MSTAKLPDRNLPWPIEWSGVELIAGAEDCVLKAYLCPAKRWTCGWGETDGVTPNTAWTQEFADQRFCDSLNERVDQVLALCTVQPTPNQLSALVSLSYNIGIGEEDKPKLGGLMHSSVLKAHNRGDYAAAARAFLLYNKAHVGGGPLVTVHGLDIRRHAEAAMYLRPNDDAPRTPLPQAVAPEPAVAPQAAPAALATLGAAATAAGQANDQIAQVKTLVLNTLGVPEAWFLPGLVLGVGGYLIYRHYAMRRQGWH